MKKIKSPWYGIAWIGIWTAALIWFLTSDRFNMRESVGLVLVWGILVGITVYMLLVKRQAQASAPRAKPVPSLNALCPCGSGKKYKRCCGETPPPSRG